MGYSPRAVSNQRKGSRFRAQPLTEHGGSNPGPLAFEADALPTVPRGRPAFSAIGGGGGGGGGLGTAAGTVAVDVTDEDGVEATEEPAA